MGGADVSVACPCAADAHDGRGPPALPPRTIRCRDADVELVESHAGMARGERQLTPSLSKEVALMHPAHTHRRAPDWIAAAVSGFAAGAVLMVIDLLWSLATTGAGPWVTSHMIAATVMGPHVLQSHDFGFEVVTVALVAHYLLGVAFGLVLVAVSAPFRLDATIGAAALTGTVFGIVLYLVNFYGMAVFFPWFAEIRGWTALIAHVIFGVTAAVLYWKLERRGEVLDTPPGARLS
jgi:hypothetical protein